MKYHHLMLAAALLAACAKPARQAEQVKNVRLATVQQGGGEDTLRLPGRVVADQDISLSFRVAGRVARVLVREGQAVSQGQLLAELDEADYRVQLDAAEAEHAQAAAEAARVLALYEDSATTASARDRAVYGLRQLDAKLRHCRDQLSYCQLRAPFAGTVQRVIFDGGETVEAGMPVLGLVGSALPRVEVNLPAADYVRRADFLHYSCRFDAHPGRVYPLSLIGIAPRATSTQLYTAHLQLPEDVEVGLNTVVTITAAAPGGDFLVPTTAVAGGTLFVYNNEDSVVRQLDVTVRRLLPDGRCVVYAPGLRAGQQVVGSGTASLRHGDRVRPVGQVSATNVGGLL